MSNDLQSFLLRLGEPLFSDDLILSTYKKRCDGDPPKHPKRGITLVTFSGIEQFRISNKGGYIILTHPSGAEIKLTRRDIEKLIVLSAEWKIKFATPNVPNARR